MTIRKSIPGGFEARAINGKTEEYFDKQRKEFTADVDAVRRALLRQLRNGTDIGEFIYYAFKAAQEQVEPGFNLLDNRPGSWEAASLDTMMENVILGIQAERREAAEAARKAQQ